MEKDKLEEELKLLKSQVLLNLFMNIG